MPVYVRVMQPFGSASWAGNVGSDGRDESLKRSARQENPPQGAREGAGRARHVDASSNSVGWCSRYKRPAARSLFGFSRPRPSHRRQRYDHCYDIDHQILFSPM